MDPLIRPLSTPIDLTELIPELAGIRSARALVAEQLADARRDMETRAAELSPVELGRQVADAARRGVRSPIDLAAAFTEQRAAVDVSGEVLEALRTAESVLAMDEHNTITARLDRALAALHDRLGDVLARVRDIAPALGPVRTAEDAVQAGEDAVSAYTAVRNLLKRYKAIRDTQRVLTSFGWSGRRSAAGGVLQVAGEFANLDDIWPCWPLAISNTGYLDKRTNMMTLPPWPEDADPFQPTYSLAYLLWAAEPTNPAKVWVPTRTQLEEAYDAAHRAVDLREQVAEDAAGLGRPVTEYMPSQV